MLLVVLPLVLLPFLTYFVSTHLFYRRANSKAIGSTPPTIPYFLPGVFHSFDLVYDGPQRYFATLLYGNFLVNCPTILMTSSKYYGNFSPFQVRLGTSSFVVLRDPHHLKKAVEATKLDKTNIDVLKRIFGVPETALKLYSGTGISEDGTNSIEYARAVLPRKHFTGAKLYLLIDDYISILSCNMHDKMFQVGTWTLIEDFRSFLQQVVTKCTVYTLFGSAFAKEYPGFVKDFWEFEDAIQAFVPGVPRVLSSTAYEAPRDRLLRGIEKWLRTYHSGSEFSRLGADDPVVDEYRGSKFIQETDLNFAKTDGMDLRARAAEMLIIMQSSISTSVSSSFWMIVEVLRKPDLAKHLKTESVKYYSSHSGRPDVAGIASMSIVQSIQMEVERLRLAKYLVRHNDGADCRIDDLWTIPRGCSALGFSLDVALNTKLWAKMQPRSVERPLEEFWAERFLLSEEVNVKVHSKTLGGKASSRCRTFGLDGLDPVVLALRGDQYARLGSDFTQSLQAATLALLLNEFELHLGEPEILDSATPAVGDSAYGTVNLLAKVAVRIRKLSANETH